MPRASETSSGPNFQSAVKWYVFFTFIVACFHLVHVPRRPVFQALICHIKKMNLKKCTIADRLAPLGQRSSWITWATRVSCTALWPLQNTHNTYELQHIYRYIPIQFTTRGEWKKVVITTEPSLNHRALSLTLPSTSSLQESVHWRVGEMSP